MIPNVATVLGVVGELEAGIAGAIPDLVNVLVSLDLKNFSRLPIYRYSQWLPFRGFHDTHSAGLGGAVIS